MTTKSKKLEFLEMLDAERMTLAEKVEYFQLHMEHFEYSNGKRFSDWTKTPEGTQFVMCTVNDTERDTRQWCVFGKYHKGYFYKFHEKAMKWVKETFEAEKGNYFIHPSRYYEAYVQRFTVFKDGSRLNFFKKHFAKREDYTAIMSWLWSLEGYPVRELPLLFRPKGGEWKYIRFQSSEGHIRPTWNANEEFKLYGVEAEKKGQHVIVVDDSTAFTPQPLKVYKIINGTRAEALLELAKLKGSKYTLLDNK